MRNARNRHDPTAIIAILLLLAACSPSSSRHSTGLEVQKRTRHFIFRGENMADEHYINETSKLLESSYIRICDAIGYLPEGKIDVEVYSDLQKALGYPGPINGYAGNGKIQVNSPGNDSNYYQYMLKVPVHELVHVIFNKANNGLSERWISEGLAEYLADGPRTKDTRNRYIKLAVDNGFDGGLHELSMAFSSRNADEAITAYSIASDFVGFLVTRYGTTCIKELITDKMEYEKVFDAPIQDLYQDYKAELRDRFRT